MATVAIVIDQELQLQNGGGVMEGERKRELLIKRKQKRIPYLNVFSVEAAMFKARRHSLSLRRQKILVRIGTLC